ncbi:MAG: YkoF family thiamine/hydroxymethylpyrimidine-binding protein [Woeseiaceae bacterium]|nr:YkoF family thiamine/hydroxymethylpyrimidine-binding protein [Woeseiaceae bacterium]
MCVAVDISLYPLDADFIPPIKDVIDRLNAYESIDVVTNPMATQLRGEYDEVMDVLKQEIGTTFEQIPKAVFAIKILNNPVAE